ncbi:MAG TPA: dual specificity protein phosphatase family protein [Polyangiaceae bacterium]|jgi:protein-tyrosine phosphatase
MARVEPKFVAVFAAGTTAVAVGATFHPALAWPAVAFGLVGLGYAGLGARPFMKRPTGRHNPIAIGLLGPYMAIAWIILLFLRLRAEEAYDEVRPKLFVGRQPLRTRELPLGVSLLVDLTAEFPGLRPKGVEYICLPTLDGSASDDLGAVRELVEKIRAHRGVVYVHCAAGHGRSVAIVACVLVAEGRAKSMEEALALIRRVRPAVGLSRSQRELVRAIASCVCDVTPAADSPTR